jgi:hypothetical protein
MIKGDIKKYIFSESVAIEVGFEEAVMLSNIHFWVKHNEKIGHENHFHNGKFWTYGSVEYFVEQYPFWTHSMIKRILKKLKDANYIETGVFNKYGYDKTKWYTTTQKTDQIMEKQQRNE